MSVTGPWCESCERHPAAVRETFWAEYGRVEFLVCVSCAGVKRQEDYQMTSSESEHASATGRDQHVEALVRLYRQYSAEIGRMEEQRAEIKARIHSLVDVGAIGVVDGVTWQKLAPSRRFDLATAVANLPAEVVTRCAATGLDASKVRAAAQAAGVLEACMVENPSAAPVLRLA